jgi:hypothetical protein
MPGGTASAMYTSKRCGRVTQERRRMAASTRGLAGHALRCSHRTADARGVQGITQTEQVLLGWRTTSGRR